MADNVVKSVRRVFEILELFEHERCNMPAIEIAQKLRYPLTSTHAILKSMQELGYLRYTTQDRSYFPAHSLPNLFHWMGDAIEPGIVDYVKALSHATRETINISRQMGTQVKIIYGLDSKHAIGVSVNTGTTMAIVNSLTGITSIAGLNDEERKQFFAQLKKQDKEQATAVDIKLIEETLDTIKKEGLVTRCDMYVEGIGAMCQPIVSPNTQEILVVGIVGPSNRIVNHAEEYKKSIVELVERFNIKTLYPIII